MSQVLIGLVGVIVGGLLTALTSWLLDLSRDRRQREDRLQREAQELKRAARLIEQELSENLTLMCRAVETRRWWHHPGHSLRTSRWGEYEPLFAGTGVDDETWFDVTLAYQIVREAIGVAEDARLAGDLPLTPKQDLNLRLCIAAVDEGRFALRELTGDIGGPFVPDLVAAMRTAAADAAQDLLPGEMARVAPFDDRQELRVVVGDRSAIGVALLEPPAWTFFRCVLPLGVKLRVLLPAIEGTTACALFSPERRDSASLERLVPEEIRSDPRFTDFLVLLKIPDDVPLVGPC